MPITISASNQNQRYNLVLVTSLLLLLLLCFITSSFTVSPLIYIIHINKNYTRSKNTSNSDSKKIMIIKGQGGGSGGGSSTNQHNNKSNKYSLLHSTSITSTNSSAFDTGDSSEQRDHSDENNHQSNNPQIQSRTTSSSSLWSHSNRSSPIPFDVVDTKNNVNKNNDENRDNHHKDVSSNHDDRYSDDNNEEVQNRNKWKIKSPLRLLRMIPFVNSTSTTHSSSSKITTISTPISTPYNPTSIINLKSLSLRKITIFILLSILTVFVTLFLQGVLHLTNYRRHFGHAPIPEAPSHGLIVTHSKKDRSYSIVHENNQIGMDHDNNEKHDQNYTFRTFHHQQPLMQHQEDENGEEEQYPQPRPLRLLLIGDSIARGVGQSQNCYPILPQSIARTLSLSLNNRAIYWTTMAIPGASTKWLSDVVEDAFNKKVKKKRKERKQHQQQHMGQYKVDNGSDIENGIPSSSPVSLQEFIDRHVKSTKSMSANTKQEWVSNLEYHKKLYEDNPFGHYDLILVLSGINDVKRLLVPFLLSNEVVETDDGLDEDEYDDYDQDHHLHLEGGDSKEKTERGFASDMKKLITLLNKGHSLDYKWAHEQQLSNSHGYTATTTTTCESIEHDNEETYLLSKHDRQDVDRHSPMIVFPQFPTKDHPVKMGPLLKWVGVFLSGKMDKVKERIADQYDNVMSSEFTSTETIIEYISRHCNDNEPTSDLLNDEKEIMVNLVDMSCEECEKREDDMKKFYSQRKSLTFTENNHSWTKVASIDGIHPK